MHWNAVNRMLIYAVCSACALKKSYLRCFDFWKFVFNRKQCVMFCFALLTCCALCAASQCKQKNNTSKYFRLWFISIHHSMTSYKKPITGY